MTCEQYAQLYHLERTAYALGNACLAVGGAMAVLLLYWGLLKLWRTLRGS